MFAFRLVSLCVLLLAGSPPAYAEIKTIASDASYIMGDGETPDFAEARALQKAKQTALEEAGTYVESYTKVQNFDLTTEEIQTIAGGVLQVEVLEKTRSLVANGLRFYTKIKATITTDKMEELARRIKGKNVAEEYAQLQTEYARLAREVESWKQRAGKISQGRERDAVIDRIREGEKAFARVQQREGELFQRLVSGKRLVESANRDKEIIDDLVKMIVDSGYIVTVGEIKASVVSGRSQPDQLLLNVPLTIRVSQTLREAVSNAVNVLGGTMRPDVELALGNGYPNYPLRIGRGMDYDAKDSGRGVVFGSGPAVTVVRIARDLEVAKYFQHEVEYLGFILEFLDNTSMFSVCRLGPKVTVGADEAWMPLRRLFPIQAIRLDKTLNERGTQPPDSEDQKHGVRFPGHGALQGGDLLSLRRARSVPRLNPEAPTLSGRTATRIGNGGYDLPPELNTFSGPDSTTDQDRGYVAIVGDEATFVIQQMLSAESVRKLTGVRASAYVWRPGLSFEYSRTPPPCTIVP